MKKLKFVKIIIATVYLSLGISNLFAQSAGEVDETWGNSGWIIADNINNATELFYDLITLEDDDFLMVGYVSDTSYHEMLIVRYNNDGSLDQSFGGGDGVVRINLSTEGNDYAYSVKELLNGELLITGRTSTVTGADVVLMKLEANGSFDNSFGTSGVATYSFGNPTYSEPIDLEVMADNSVIIGGFFHENNDSDVFLLKFTPKGGLDISFGNNGVFIFDSPTTPEAMTSMEINDNGDIYATLNRDYGTSETAILLKVDNTGTLDLSFNTTGFVEYSQENENYFNDLKVDENGKIIVAGEQGFGNDFDGLIIKYNADGTLNQTFGSQGVITLDKGAANGIFLNNLETMQNGKMIVSGNASGQALKQIYAYIFDGAIGSPDCSFSSCNGMFLDYYFSPVNYKGDLLTFLSDGSILLGGFSTSLEFTRIQTYITKVNNVSQNVGIESSAFVGSKVLIYPNPTFSDFSIDVSDGEKINEIQLISYEGRNVQSWIGNSTKYSLNNDISPGSYFIKVLTNKGFYTNNLTIK
ncbi:MAG: T9SS type A sorting domain-containing protein [Brumimicrobium sp.]